MKVFEIFTSIDGEINGFGQGRITTFIRFSGCNLSCPYCDSADTIDGEIGIDMTIDDILNVPEIITAQNITLTGGEPLLWLSKGFEQLCYHLIRRGKYINVETNGTILPPHDFLMKWGSRISWTVDLKLDQIEKHQFKVSSLTANDTLKIVISSEEQLEEAISFLKRCQKEINYYCKMAISPNLQKITAKHIIERLIEEELFEVFLNVQLHKFIDLK